MYGAMMDSGGNGGSLNGAALLSFILAVLTRKWTLVLEIYMSDNYDSFPQFRAPKKSVFNLIVCGIPNGRLGSWNIGSSQASVKIQHVSLRGLLSRAVRTALGSAC